MLEKLLLFLCWASYLYQYITDIALLFQSVWLCILCFLVDLYDPYETPWTAKLTVLKCNINRNIVIQSTWVIKNTLDFNYIYLDVQINKPAILFLFFF